MTGALFDFRIASAATGTAANWAWPESTAGTVRVPSATITISASIPCFRKKPRSFAYITCPVASTAMIATLTFVNGGFWLVGRRALRRPFVATASDDESAETRGARERPLRLPASSPCGHRPADTGDRNAFCDEINAWISFRVSRNRAELRVSVCERGRGRPMSTDPITRPGWEPKTSTRSAR